MKSSCPKPTARSSRETCRRILSRHGGRSLRSPPCQKSRTDTNRKSKQWTTPKPTQNNHPHDVVISNIKFHLNDISSQSETMSAVFMMLFGLAVYSSIHPKLSYFCVLELFDRCVKNYNIVILLRTRRLCHLIMKQTPAHHGYRPGP